MKCRSFPRSISVLTVVLADFVGEASGQTKPDTPFTSTVGRGVFLIVTDIHFDPFTQPNIVPKLDQNPVENWPQIFADGAGDKFQTYGTDAGYPLTQSALSAAAATELAFDFILYTGDYLSHDFEQNYDRYAGSDSQGLTSFSVKTAKYVSNTIAYHLPDIPIFGVMGNTDAVCGDYVIAPDSAFTSGLKSQWQDLSGQPNAFETFDIGGFYKARHPTVADHDIIVLNDIFWSVKYQDSCNETGGNPGDAMMSWLDWQLYLTQQAGRKAYILLHVPPGINAYSTSRGFGSCKSNITPFWEQPYEDDFAKLMQKYSDVVDYTFSGHTHMDSFAIINDATNKPTVASHITPAVSPIFGNNPAFTAYQYDKSTGDIMDAATWHLTNLQQAHRGEKAIWQLEYIFSLTYGAEDMSAPSLAKVSDAISTNDVLRTKFIEFYAVLTESTNPVNSRNLTAFTCAQTSVTRADFEDCYCVGD